MRKTAEVIPLGNAMSQQKWVDRIVAAWREQLPSIFETGNLLEAAKGELAHGLWMEMIREKLPFGQSAANKLMAIADNDNLRNSDHGPNLPVCWRTLYELTLLTNDQFAEGIKTRAINPKMERKDVKILRGIEPKKKEPKARPPSGLSEILSEWCSQTSSVARGLTVKDRENFFIATERYLTDLKKTLADRDAVQETHESSHQAT